MIKRYLKIKRPTMSGYTDSLEQAIQELKDSFEYDEPGDELHFEIVEMEEEEYKTLPEFEGW